MAVTVGGTSITFNDSTTQNSGKGVASAWVTYYAYGSVSVLASHNISSVTRNGTGDSTINFINAMQSANYSVNVNTCGFNGNTILIGGVAGSQSGGPTLQNTTQVRIQTVGGGSGLFEMSRVYVSIHG